MSRPMGSIVVAMWLGLTVTAVAAGEPIYLDKTEAERGKQLRSRAWIEVIEQEIPPLKNGPGDRMPMIMWHGVGFAPLPPSQITILRDRGLCQHLQLSESMIPAAKVLQDAGMPVILMEGRTDSWPYSLAGEPDAWAHQFDLTYQPPWFGKEDTSQWHGACPKGLDGWRRLAENTRKTLRKFREAGVQVDAVLVDYEGDPYPWSHLFDQLRHCKRCRKELSSNIVYEKISWRNYAWQQYVGLYDEYFARPVRDVFPNCLVTNWHVVYSSPEHPVRYFVNEFKLPPLEPKYFNATNPIAYGSDVVWHKLWDRSTELTSGNVDAFYSQQITHQVAADRRNRESSGAAGVRAIPWVARVCKIAGNDEPPAPIMSRERYRDSLRELWLLGIHSMQIFNPMNDGYEELALIELQDAVAAYDDMLGRLQCSIPSRRVNPFQVDRIFHVRIQPDTSRHSFSSCGEVRTTDRHRSCSRSPKCRRDNQRSRRISPRVAVCPRPPGKLPPASTIESVPSTPRLRSTRTSPGFSDYEKVANRARRQTFEGDYEARLPWSAGHSWAFLFAVGARINGPP